jgi:hypothetical protein
MAVIEAGMLQAIDAGTTLCNLWGFSWTTTMTSPWLHFLWSVLQDESEVYNFNISISINLPRIPCTLTFYAFVSKNLCYSRMF